MKWGRRRLSKRHNPEIAPDEIFLDSTNLPEFDRSKLEGKLERPISHTTYVALGGVLVFALGIVFLQAGNLEVWQGTAYAARSAENVLSPETVFASRGAILDRNGVPLVTNTEGSDGFAERAYKTPGFSSVLGYVSYPKKDSSGHYYDTTMTGVAGLEKSFDTELAGQNGTVLVEKDALGNKESEGTVIPPVPGKNLTLSLDSRVQTAFYDAIKDTAEQGSFKGGAGIIMDVETGELYALVSYPEYDSNVLSSGGPSDVIESYAHDARGVYLNRAVQGLYAPGSTVKPVEAAGALTDGVITPDTAMNGTGSISIPNPYDPAHPSVFLDWKVIGWEDLRKAIAWSSDVYFYMVGGGYQGMGGLGIDRLDAWFRLFGFTTPTGIEIPGETHGFVPTPAWKEATYDEPWRIGDTYHTAIGQYAVQVTPIELARAIAVIANGGKLVQPTLIARQLPAGETVAVSPAALQVVREGMRMGVTEGTSHALADLSFTTLAGKTGTAQTGMKNENYNAWAVGFFPYDHPKYVYTVVLEKGLSGNTIGGVLAMHEFLTALHEAAPDFFGDTSR
jgi:penicillin-binding protein 2